MCRDRFSAVKAAAAAAGRSPPEIAYQLGELLHNHFRTRGVTLTSYELRRLVAELIALNGPPEQKDNPADKGEALSMARSVVIVASDGEPPEGQWPGDAAPTPAPSVPEKALQPPPMPIPAVTVREPAPFAQPPTRRSSWSRAGWSRATDRPRAPRSTRR